MAGLSHGNRLRSFNIHESLQQSCFLLAIKGAEVIWASLAEILGSTQNSLEILYPVCHWKSLGFHSWTSEMLCLACCS